MCSQLGRGNLQFPSLLKGTTRQLCQGGESSLKRQSVLVLGLLNKMVMLT
jgi:hypothetical protein